MDVNAILRTTKTIENYVKNERISLIPKFSMDFYPPNPPAFLLYMPNNSIFVHREHDFKGTILAVLLLTHHQPKPSNVSRTNNFHQFIALFRWFCFLFGTAKQAKRAIYWLAFGGN